MSKKRESFLMACVYCGEPATTRDHVPPQSIFVGITPAKLITVPACETCNNNFSQFDEKFRNIIGMKATEESSLMIWEKTLRSLKRRHHDLQDLRESLQEVPIFAKNGLYRGVGTQGAFDVEAHDRTVERITRGLYFHHFGEPLPADSPVEAYPIRDGAEWLKDVAPLPTQMRVQNIGGSAIFEYGFARAEGEPGTSLWIYRFHACHVAAAETGALVSSND